MSKRSKKILFAVIAVIAAAICVYCSIYLVQYIRGNILNTKVGSLASTNNTFSQQSDAVVVDIDFDALHEMNDEIYAWVEVPGTTISYPVVQSATYDLFYNSHAVDRSTYYGGSIFSQRYNTTTFDEPMTVLYGHNLHSKYMFAPVNDFADSKVFDANQYIYIYTPDTVYEYTIFAAYPHSNEHLLRCHDFTDESQWNSYFDAVLRNSEIDANFREDAFPAFGEKVLTLSTCYRQNRLQRYLLQGVLTAQYPVVQK